MVPRPQALTNTTTSRCTTTRVSQLALITTIVSFATTIFTSVFTQITPTIVSSIDIALVSLASKGKVMMMDEDLLMIHSRWVLPLDGLYSLGHSTSTIANVIGST